jgi:hypothetical protein
MIADVSRAAVFDAGLGPEDIDGLLVGPQAPPPTVAASARAGARPRPGGPPMDYRDKPLPPNQEVPDCTPIPVPPSAPIDRTVQPFLDVHVAVLN